jgi:hypothetical protein
VTAGVWARPAGRLLAGANLAGAALIMIAWWGVIGAATFRQQFAGLALAAAGVTLALAADIGWVLNGRSAVAGLRRTVLPGMVALRPVRRSGQGVTDRPSGPSAPTAPFVAAGTRRYHRPDCLLVRGKDVTALSGPTAEHPEACEVCEPEPA